MLGSFLDKLGGFFDRRFIFAYIIPTLTLLLLLITVLQTLFGPQATLNWWAHLDGQEKIILTSGVLLVTILVASIFEMITTPVVRLYEGYWNEGFLTRLAIARQQKIKNKYTRIAKKKELGTKMEELIAKRQASIDDEQQKLIDEQIASIDIQKTLEDRRAYNASYYIFPLDDDLLKPTSLGNVLAAAEEYSFQVYRLDSVIWWPRLATLLPETFRTQVDIALTPMLTVLNLTSIFILGALVEGYLLLSQHHWFLCGFSILSGLLLARVCYTAAINQAVVYGRFVRVAFDLYRHDILKQMHIPVPDNLVGERILWDLLTEWHYFYRPPWEASNDKPELDDPFYYDMHVTSTDTLQQQKVTITFQGYPNPTLNEEIVNKSDH